jgi:hypothetical protein
MQHRNGLHTHQFAKMATPSPPIQTGNPFDFQHVEHVIVSILRGQNIGEYNQFILSFVETDVAWEVSMRLCAVSVHLDVQYFGVNMLYTKVRLHFHFVQLCFALCITV